MGYLYTGMGYSYTEGLVTAIVVGIFAVLLPVLWMAWWLIADLGDETRARTRHRPTS